MFIILFLFCFLLFIIFTFFFIFLFFFDFYVFSLSLFFPYFRGNSLNSRADLEFKEIRLFPRWFFKKKKVKFSFLFFEKSSWKKKKPLGFSEKHIEFQSFFFEKSSWKKVEFP